LVFIYGAGRGGEILLREILHNKKLNVKPVGFIDDDTLKTGKKLQGYPILGTFSDLNRLHNKYEINGILISFNYTDKERYDAIRRFCSTNGLFTKQFSIDLKDVDLSI
jgi:UDP-GlcNAc:undecaprenyl-phosphate GlcNAc-1-phosphate transferase